MHMRFSAGDTVLRGLFLAILAGGCGDDGGGGDSDSDSSTGTTGDPACVADSAPTWESFGRDFFVTYCNHCHSESLKGNDREHAPFDVNFDTVELVRMQTLKIGNAAAAEGDDINTFMPVGDPKPSDEERRILGEWLACGAP